MSSQNHSQDDVIAFLSNPESYAQVARVDRFETHGNLVFLAGSDAWKIKRAVRFPYMDFSTIAKRHAACAREVEINRQFGSDFYLGCEPIARSRSGTLGFGCKGDVVEWAVHMRRFEQSALLSAIAVAEGVSSDLAHALAEVVYQAHQRATPVKLSSGAASARDLTVSISGALAKSQMPCPELALLDNGLRKQIEIATATLDERAANSFVRRCHGDLHLANIVVWQGRPALYDAIEFDEAMATVDTLHDLAFLLMDLERHGQRPAANAVLNRYLALSGKVLDLRGLIALPLFLALRAAVRAVVTIDRAEQECGDARARDVEKARAYLAAAITYLNPPPPRIVAIGGLSGSGKTSVAACLAPRLGPAPGAVHLRTDVERKRLAGVGELEPLPDSSYAPEARKRVYQTLNDKAQSLLRAGHAVVIDAVFADHNLRENVRQLAREAGVPFHGIWLQAGPETLIKRVAARGGDASDATPEVVQAQLRSAERPFAAEWATVDAGGTLAETLAGAQTVLGVFESGSRKVSQP